MMMKITARTVYGTTKYYPSCAASRAYAEALATKTLTSAALGCARRMGFAVTLDGDTAYDKRDVGSSTGFYSVPRCWR